MYPIACSLQSGIIAGIFPARKSSLNLDC